MVSFGAESTGIPSIGTASQPLGGVRHVQEREPVLLTGLTNLVGQYGEARGKKSLSDFTAKQLQIIQAVDQGVYGSQYGRTLIRKNFIEAITNHPGLREDLISTNAAILGQAGMGDIITQGTIEERREEGLRDALVSNGYVSPDASDEEFEAGKSVFMKAAEAERVYTEEMRTINLKQARTNMSAAEAAAETANATYKFITEAAPAKIEQATLTVQDILKNAEMDSGMKVASVEDYFLGLETELAPYLAQLSSHEADALKRPLGLLKDHALKLAKGEYDTEAFEAELNHIKKLNQLLLLRDPAIQRVVAVSELAPGILTDATLNANAARVVGNFLDLNGTETTDTANLYVEDADGVNALNAYTNGLQNADTTDPKVAQEVETNIKNIFNGVEDYAGVIARDPKKAIAFSDWLSTDGFFQLRTAHPEWFTNLDTAREVLKENLYSEVFAMVKSEFNAANVTTGYTQNTDGTAGITPNTATGDSLITWRPSAEGMEFVAIDPENRAAIKEAKRLNRELKPIINKAVKAFSHLDGNQNYTANFEAIAGDLLFENSQGDMQDKDTGDELSMSDFQTYIESQESLGGVAGSVVDAGAGYTVVTTEDGTTERRTGTRAWRNNNPGNIEYGSFAKSMGAVGSDGRFAVFRSYDEGVAAKEALLFNSKGYSGKTILQAISRYAPSFENDTEAYASTIAAAAGVDINTPLADLSPEQRKLLLKAMERVEGYKTGTVEIIEE